MAACTICRILGTDANIDPVTDAARHVEAALERICATIVMLEAIRAAGAGGRPPDEQIGRAIASLREAVAHLRAVSGTRGHPAASGFVVGARGRQPRLTRVR